MAVTYSAAVKTARMQAVIDQIGAAGTLEIGTAGMASVLAVLPLANPSGSAANGVLTFDFDPDIEDLAADNGGTAAEAQIKDGADAVVISGLTVGESGSGADIILDNTDINAGQPVRLATGTITHA